MLQKPVRMQRALKLPTYHYFHDTVSFFSAFVSTFYKNNRNFKENLFGNFAVGCKSAVIMVVAVSFSNSLKCKQRKLCRDGVWITDLFYHLISPFSPYF